VRRQHGNVLKAEVALGERRLDRQLLGWRATSTVHGGAAGQLHFSQPGRQRDAPSACTRGLVEAATPVRSASTVVPT